MSMSIDTKDIKKDKIIFIGFNKNTTVYIKDILHRRQSVLLDIVFENNIQEARDIVAGEFLDLMAVFVNISPKYRNGVASVCGYVASIASLIQDALESDITVVLSYPLKRHALFVFFSELDRRQEEDFRVGYVEDINTENLPTLIESIKKNKYKKHPLV